MAMTGDIFLSLFMDTKGIIMFAVYKIIYFLGIM